MASGISGFNVTIPHKVSVMEHLDSVAESCSLVGAANVVSCADGQMRGYNTDMDGFLRPLDEHHVRLPGMRVLLLGAGGAARAAAAALATSGVSGVTICNRTLQTAKDLSEYCTRLGADSTYGPLPDKVPEEFDMVVNATAAGMGGTPYPVNTGTILEGTIMYDMVYRPITTAFLRAGIDAGGHPIYGWEMLLSQAELSFEVWLGTKAPRAAMKRVLLGGFS